ncbi:MAG: hypothetical protein V8S98_01685 [Lachnospiraceae bacterium]
MPEYDVAMYTHKKMKTNTESFLRGLNGAASHPGSPGGLQ